MRKPRFRRLLRVPFPHRESLTREVDEEILSHLEQRVESLVDQGLSREAAWAEAKRRFGTVGGAMNGTRRRLHAQAAARQRRVSRRVWFESLRHDLVFAVRQARRAPGHSLMVVLVLALGIGASTAVFTVMNAVLLRPLPFPEPDRLAVIWSLDSLGNRANASPPTWRDWQDGTHAFEGIALQYATPAPVVPTASGGAAVTATAAFVSENFFDVLRPRIRQGRAFSAADGAVAEGAVVVSERFWRGPLGRPQRFPVTLTVYGRPREVIGVLADESAYPAEADLWISGAYRSSPQPRNTTQEIAIGRLTAGGNFAQAEQELDAVMAGIREREPDAIYAYGVSLESLREHLVGDTAGSIRLVTATGLLLLLIACANAAAANLVRCTTRLRELVIRTSLGAARGRILRQLIVEQLVLAMVSGALGLWLADVGTRWLAGAAADQLPRIRELGFDARVVAVAGACILLSALIAGLAPLVLLRRRALASGMQSQRSTQGRRLGRVLVATQVAVAFTLLAGAALLVESFRVLMARDLGFDTERVATVNIPLLGPKYESSQWMPFLRDLERSVKEVRGVEAVGFSTAPPLNESKLAGGVQVEGAFGDLRYASYRVVSDRYFEAIGTPILSGRGFDSRDVRGALPVTVVNHTMAERYWPGESPIGKRLRAPDMDGSNAPWLTVVGVVGDARQWGYASDPEPEHYLSYRQRSGFTWGMTLVVRSNVALDRVLPAVRARLRALDPDIPSELRPLDAQVSRSVTQWRLPMSIVSAFGLLALVLAALGVYTVFAFLVSQRTREIGLRIALGATGGAVLRGTLRDALAVTLAGAAIGSMAAYLLTGFARTMLFEGTPVDIRPLAAAWAVVICAAVLAAFVPARRASRVDPTVALRVE